jgi:hypothetical protein
LKEWHSKEGYAYADLHVGLHESFDVFAAELDKAVVQDLIEQLLIVLSDLYFLSFYSLPLLLFFRRNNILIHASFLS